MADLTDCFYHGKDTQVSFCHGKARKVLIILEAEELTYKIRDCIASWARAFLRKSMKML